MSNKAQTTQAIDEVRNWLDTIENYTCEHTKSIFSIAVSLANSEDEQIKSLINATNDQFKMFLSQPDTIRKLCRNECGEEIGMLSLIKGMDAASRI